MNHQDRSDAGFTLVELLVVLVIMPMIVGAIAAAIVTTQNGSSVAQATLSDSNNAQITSEFYVRDVQGAQSVTTFYNPAADADDYNASTPQVCRNPNLANPSRQPVLALYRPSTPKSGAFSVGYWIGSVSATDPTRVLVRDACTVTGAFATTFSSEMVMSDHVTVSQVVATITPASFAARASAGWTGTSALASTTLSQDRNLGSGPFQVFVATTSGFQGGASYRLSILTDTGVQTVTCTGFVGNTTFNTCGNSLRRATAGDAVLQPTSISGIDISVTEPGSGYAFTLGASPRVWSSQQSIVTPPVPTS